MPSVEQVFPAQPITTAAGRIIASPFQFVLTGEDNLRITTWGSKAGVTVTIQGRRLPAAGPVEVFAFSHVASTNYVSRAEMFVLGAGAILNLTIFVASGAPKRGQVFVRAEIVRGLSGGTTVLGTLLQGYITEQERLAWPGSPLQTSLDGPGHITSGFIPPPLSGIGEWVHEQTSDVRWEVLAIIALLTTDANVATRQANIDVYNKIDGVTTLVCRVPHPFTQSASQAKGWCWVAGLPFETVVYPNLGVAGWPPGLSLVPGMLLQSGTAGIQAGDAWTLIRYHVREHLEITT